LAETSGRVRAEVDVELWELGLDWPCRLALVIVRAVGGLPQEALSDRTGIDRSSPSVLVRDLEADGFLERCPHPEDARKVVCRPTRAGSGIEAEAQRAVDAGTRAALRRLTARERLRLEKLLAKALGAREQDRHWLFG
jgi:DNA-binding MarR family transcriptional regulator